MCTLEKTRRTVFYTALALLFIIAGACALDSLLVERCVGVRILNEEIIENAVYEYEDYSNYILMNKEKAAVDVEKSRIYVSYNAETDSGSFKVSNPFCAVFFAEDEAFNDMPKAIEEGHAFKLIVMNIKRHYMSYDVIFTTLPVMRMYVDNYRARLDGRDEAMGTMTLWNADDSEMGNYSTFTTDLCWHIRGGSTAGQVKKSLKLSLCDSNGQNKNVSLLGLGSDDDWILNAMTMDDTKLKEKFTMDIWNQIFTQNEQNKKMSTGEYVELVLDGRYNGLYLLQRRIDSKYLETRGGILLKGYSSRLRETLQKSYEIISSPLTNEQTYEYLERIKFEQDAKLLSLSNFIDVNILLQFGSMPDNTDYKNMFYLLSEDDGVQTVTFIPWDTDMSYGVTWSNGINYDYDHSLNMAVRRMEYESVNELYPDLDNRTATRWQQLRESGFTYDWLMEQLHAIQKELQESGAFDREYSRWERRYGEKDRWGAMEKYIEERLAWLDAYYAA